MIDTSIIEEVLGELYTGDPVETLQLAAELIRNTGLFYYGDREDDYVCILRLGPKEWPQEGQFCLTARFRKDERPVLPALPEAVAEARRWLKEREAYLQAYAEKHRESDERSKQRVLQAHVDFIPEVETVWFDSSADAFRFHAGTRLYWEATEQQYYPGRHGGVWRIDLYRWGARHSHAVKELANRVNSRIRSMYGKIQGQDRYHVVDSSARWLEG